MSEHSKWDTVKAKRAAGVVVPPEQVIASLKQQSAQRWDMQGEQTVAELLRLLNSAESFGYTVTGVVEDEGERQVFVVSWYNGLEWCETRITRGEAQWEVNDVP